MVNKFAVRAEAIERVTPYEGNPRHIPETAVRKVAESIRRFGWQQPIVVDEDKVLLAGHTRLKAAVLLRDEGAEIPRWSDAARVPIHVAQGLSETEKRAYRLADNRTGAEAGWDSELLCLELKQLHDDGDDLVSTGFNQSELTAILTATAKGIDAEAEWIGMPEYKSDDKMAHRSLLVHFPNEEAVQKFAELVNQKITDSTRMLWYPTIEIERYADKVYDAAS